MSTTVDRSSSSTSTAAPHTVTDRHRQTDRQTDGQKHTHTHRQMVVWVVLIYKHCLPENTLTASAAASDRRADTRMNKQTDNKQICRQMDKHTEEQMADKHTDNEYIQMNKHTDGQQLTAG